LEGPGLIEESEVLSVGLPTVGAAVEGDGWIA